MWVSLFILSYKNLILMCQFVTWSQNMDYLLFKVKEISDGKNE